jgi:hypothetical protein
LVGPIDQTDGAVVPEVEVIRDLPDGRTPPILMAPHGEKQLVLGRGQPGRLGLLLAPVEEAPQTGAQAEQPPIVLV